MPSPADAPPSKPAAGAPPAKPAAGAAASKPAARAARPAAAAPAQVAPRAGWHVTSAGLGIAGLVLVAGLGIWVMILQPAPPRAGLGGGNAGAASGGGSAAASQPAELPAEVKTFIADLEKKAQAAPDDLATWTRLGQVYYRAAQVDASLYPKALDAFDHVLAKNPKDLDALRGKANVYYDQNDHAHAIPLYEQVLAQNPDDPNAKTDLATMYLYAGDAKKAIATYEAVLQQHPDFMQAHYNLAVTYAQMGDNEKALERLKKARELAKDATVQKQIDDMIARLSGQGGGEAETAGTGGMPGMGGATTAAAAPSAPAPAADDGKPRTPFQADVEQRFRAAPIMGQRITRFDWSGPGTGRVVVENFPWSAMPPNVAEKFTNRLKDELKSAADAHAPGGDVKLEVVDGGGAVMTTLTPG